MEDQFLNMLMKRNLYINSHYGKFSNSKVPYIEPEVTYPEPELVCQECMIRPYKRVCVDCGKLICNHSNCCEIVIDELEHKGEVSVCYSCITGETPFADISSEVRELIDFIRKNMP